MGEVEPEPELLVVAAESWWLRRRPQKWREEGTRNWVAEASLLAAASSDSMADSAELGLLLAAGSLGWGDIDPEIGRLVLV